MPAYDERELVEYIEKHPDENRDDVAYKFFSEKVKGTVDDRKAQEVLNLIRMDAQKYIPKSKAEKEVLLALAEGRNLVQEEIEQAAVFGAGDDVYAARYKNISEAYSKYKGIDLGKAIEGIKKLMEETGVDDFDKVAGYYYQENIENADISEEQKKAYINALSSLATMKPEQEKPSKLRMAVEKDAEKYGNITQGALDYHKTKKVTEKFTPTFIDPTSGQPVYVKSLSNVSSKKPEAKDAFYDASKVKITEEDKKLYESTYDDSIYTKAKAFIKTGRYTDEKQAVTDFIIENYAAKKITKEEKEKIYANAKLAAKDVVPKNIIHHTIPTIGQFAGEVIKKGIVNNYDEAAGVYYKSILEPILTERGASEADRERVINKLADLAKVADESAKDGVVKKAVVDYIMSLPFTNSWLTEAYSSDVDDIVLSEYSKIVAREYNDKTLEEDEGFSGVVNGLARDVAVLSTLAFGTTLIRTGGKLGASALKNIAYDFVDNASGNILTIGSVGKAGISKLGIKAADFMQEKAVADLAKKYDDVRETVGMVAEVLERQRKMKDVRGLKKDKIEEIMMDAFAEADARGMDIDFNRIKTMLQEGNVKQLLQAEKKAIKGANVEVAELYDEPPTLLTRTFGTGEDIAETFTYRLKPQREASEKAVLQSERSKLEKQLYKKYVEPYSEQLGGIADSLFKEIADNADATGKSSKFWANYVFKFTDTALEDMCGFYGILTKHAYRAAESKAELLFAEVTQKSIAKTAKVFSDIAKHEFKTNEAKDFAKAIGRLNYDDARNYMRKEISNKINTGELTKEDIINRYGEDFYEFVNRFHEAQYGDIREYALQVNPSVVNVKRRRALVLKDRRADEAAKGQGWEVYDKSTGKSKFFSSKVAAQDYIDSVTVKDFEPIPDYAPRYLDFDKIKKNKEKFVEDVIKQAKSIDDLSLGDEELRKQLLSMMKKKFGIDDDDILEQQELVNKFKSQLLSVAEMRQTYNNSVFKYVDDWVKRRATRRYGHLQFSRTFDAPAQYFKTDGLAELDDGYRWASVKRLVEMEYFGEKDELFDTIEKAIASEYGENSDARNFYKKFRAIMFNRFEQDSVLDKIVAGAASYQAITKMSLSALGQFQQIAYAPARTSMRSFLKGLGGYINDRQAYKQLLDDLGFATIELRGRQMREELGLAKLSEGVLTITGMKVSDRMSRKVAALTAVPYARELMVKFAANPKKYYKDMIKAGFDVDKLMKRYSETGVLALDRHDLLKVMQKMEIDTNFRNGVMDKPLFLSTRLGRFLTTLQSATIQQARFIKRFVWDELKEGNPYPLLNLVTVGAVTGAPRQIVKQFLRGDRDVSPDMVDMAIDVGVTFGIYGNYLESLYYGMSIFGPNVSTINNATNVAEALLHADLYHAAYYTIKEVPVIHKILYRDVYKKRARERERKNNTFGRKSMWLNNKSDALRSNSVW